MTTAAHDLAALPVARQVVLERCGRQLAGVHARVAEALAHLGGEAPACARVALHRVLAVELDRARVAILEALTR